MLTSGKLKAGKQLMMDIGNGYYAAAPFIVNGNISYDPDTNLPHMWLETMLTV